MRINEVKFKPNKRLGQVFLKNRSYLKDLLEAGKIQKDDLVVEIGGGQGILTEALAKTGADIVSIERDRGLTKGLKEKFEDFPNVKIIQGDIRDILRDSNNDIYNRRYKVVANIPYYLTSYLLRLLLESQNPPTLIVLMIQKEVAERIIAKPPKSNLLAVSIQYFGEPRVVKIVPRSAFWPQPKIDSAIIQIIPNNLEKDKEKFFKLAQAGFSHPRKLLISNLCKKLNTKREVAYSAFQKLGIPLNSRGQDLTLKNWLDLRQELLHLL